MLIAKACAEDKSLHFCLASTLALVDKSEPLSDKARDKTIKGTDVKKYLAVRQITSKGKSTGKKTLKRTKVATAWLFGLILKR